MSDIPREIIERDKEGVELVTYYGVPVMELDRDGLLAALNQSIKRVRMGLDHFKRYREFEIALKKR